MVSKKIRIVSVLAASALALGGFIIPNYAAHGDPAVVVPADAVELQDYDFKVRLHPNFPQVVDYRLGDDQLAGRLGPALTTVEVNGTSQPVTVAAPVRARDRMSATYGLTFPNLAGVSVTALVEVQDQTLRLTLIDLVDPSSVVRTLRIPNHDLVTLGSTDSASQLTTARLGANGQDGVDVVERLSSAQAGAVQSGWQTLANESALAAAFSTNAGDADVNSRWQRQIRSAGADRLGSVWAGTWTEVGEGADPYVEVKLVKDANGDGVVDWQDAGIAARDILELGNGAEEVADEVITRAPVSQQLADVLAETKAVSAATENLGQRVVLQGVAGPDDAAVLGDLTALSDQGVALNTTFGYDASDIPLTSAQAAQYQELWNTGPVNVDTLYFDEWVETGAGQQLNEALQEQGWVVATHPADHRANGSDVARFIYNGLRDGWGTDPILGGVQPTAAGDDLASVWEQNLPTKFLQRSDLTSWTDAKAQFANGTVATTEQVTYDGAVVLRGGAYLLPWYDGGDEWNDEGPERLYHYNEAGGATSWRLTDSWLEHVPLTLFRLSEDGRAKVGSVTATNGQIELVAQPRTAYVLFPTADAPAGDSLPPAAFTVANASVRVNAAVSIDASTTDPEGGPLSYTAQGLPNGLTINGATGRITGTATAAGTYQVTVTAKDLAGLTTTGTFTLTLTSSVTPSATPSATPTATPSTPPATKPPATKPPTTTAPAKPFVRTAPYSLPGVHRGVNGRDWNTECEPYSQTERCRTDIWATVVEIEDGQFVRRSGWVFNNLTYLPYMTEAAWQGNPLAMHNMSGFSSGGRQWRTECHTAQTGRGACRSYTMTTVYAAAARPEGGYAFSQSNQWVFNNIVMFGGPEQR